MNDVRNMWLLKHKTYRLEHRDKKQRKINKQRENNEMYCFCPYLVKEVSCFNHFPFVPFFPDVISENSKNTHLNHIYKGVSIVLFSFSIVFTGYQLIILLFFVFSL